MEIPQEVANIRRLFFDRVEVAHREGGLTVHIGTLLEMASHLYKRELAAAIPNDELRSRIANFQIEHKASTPFDDDEYWMARSPFDQKYYVWAALPFAGVPTEPAYILDERPGWFDEYP
jgi:hypothetical protein